MRTSAHHSWFNIFRAGEHTASNGVRRRYDVETLDQIVANYDGAGDPAPIVVGHPQTNDPAYGWIGALRRSGEVLQAKASQVNDDFVQLVRDGAFRKISVSLRGDNSLRHVGFLGAKAPAVSGLGVVNWSESGDQFDYELPLDQSNEDDTMSKNTHPQPDGGKKPAKDAPAGAAADFAAREAALAEREAAVSAAEKQVQEQQARSKADFAEAEAEQKARLAALEKRAADADFAAFEAQLCAKGIVNPLGSALTRKLLDAAGVAAGVAAGGKADFAEGDDVAAAFKAALLKLPKSVDFSEHSKSDGETAADDFAESDKIIDAAHEYQKSHADVPFAQAVAAVTRQNTPHQNKG